MARKLRLTGNDLERLRRSLRDCPACKNGMDVNPNLCGQDGRCKVCYGLKVVSLIACRCRRPIKLTEDARVAEGVYSCGRKACMEAMKPQEVFAQEVYIARGWTPQDDEEAKAWSYMGC